MNQTNTAGVDLGKLYWPHGATEQACSSCGLTMGETRLLTALKRGEVVIAQPRVAEQADERALPPLPKTTLTANIAGHTVEIYGKQHMYDYARAVLTQQAMIGTASSKIVAAITAASATQQAGAAVEHAPIEQLEDEAAIDLFATAMKEKMATSRAKGRGGWNDPTACSAVRLQTMLVEHVTKGDPVDVGNFAMMLWNRGERTADVGVAFRNDGKEPDWDAYAAAEATTASASDGAIYEALSRRADPEGYAEATAQIDETLGRAQAPSREAAPDLLSEIASALDLLADTKMTTSTYVNVTNVLHHCRDAITGKGCYGASHASNAGEDTERLDFMIAEECQIEHLPPMPTVGAAEMYRVRWPYLEEHQREWNATGREAIDAARAAIAASTKEKK